MRTIATMPWRMEAYRLCLWGIVAYVSLGALVSETDIQRGAVFTAMAALAAISWMVAFDRFSQAVAWLIFWMFFGIAFAHFAGPTPAKAQHAPTFRSPYAPNFDRDDDWSHARHVRRYRKVWRHHDIDGDRCKARLAIVGDQYASEKGAREEADKAWMQTARWQYGERYMARDHARDAAYECGRSSVGSVAGNVFYRYRLSARPCRASSKGDDR